MEEMFYRDDRERIKSRSMTETLRYIEALEAIAKAAYDLWNHFDSQTQASKDASNILYDALSVVDFLDESE